jgi:phospholipase C
MVGTSSNMGLGALFPANPRQLPSPPAHPMPARRRSAVTSRITFALALFSALSSSLLFTACQGVSAPPPATLTYQLTVTAPPTGSGTVTSSPAGINCPGTCSASFTQNTQVTLTATPAANFTFTGWGGACSGTKTCVVNMTAAESVSATFTAQFGVTVTVTGSGTVTSSPAGINCSSGSCSAAFPQNTQVTLTETPASGDDFTGWSGACSGTSNCVVTVTGATSVTAAFSPAITLTVTLAGTGSGTVTSSPSGINCTTGTCSASFAPNTQVTLTATPSGSDVFNGWTGACTGTGNCTLPLTAAATVTATFNPGGTINAINHIIFFAQENRSFDHYFGYMRQYWANNGIPDQSFDGLPQFNPTSGAAPLQGPVPTNPPCADPDSNDFCDANASAPPSQWVPSFHMQSVCTEDSSPFWNEAHASWNFAFNYPNNTTWMDNGFVQAAANDARGDNTQSPPNPNNDVNGYRSMGYFTDADLNYYYFMATQFATSDRWFAPVMTRTQANRAFIYAATSQGHVYPEGTKKDPPDKNQYSAEPIVEALQNAGISWRVYVDDVGTACANETGDEQSACLLDNMSYLNEFLYEETILNSAGQTPDLLQNIKPLSQFFTDIQNESTFPSVVLIEPASTQGWDEHPNDTDTYPINIQEGIYNFSSAVINSLMTSAVWKDSAMIFTFDEPGGFFDHVQPQPVPAPNSPAGDSPYPVDLMPGDMCDGANQSTGVCSFATTGYRVPLIVISPFAKKNYVSHVVRDTTAWLSFVEERFKVAALNSRDAYWSTSAAGTNPPATMDEFFDYSNPPWMTPPPTRTQNTGGTCSDAAPNPWGGS